MQRLVNKGSNLVVKRSILNDDEKLCALTSTVIYPQKFTSCRGEHLAVDLPLLEVLCYLRVRAVEKGTRTLVDVVC